MVSDSVGLMVRGKISALGVLSERRLVQWEMLSGLGLSCDWFDDDLFSEG